MKKALFIVPHEDDELLVGGGMLLNLVNSKNWEVFVLIATNGDYYPNDCIYRITESISALNYMGVDSDHVIFLGYGDCWKNTHIYNSQAGEICTSMGGHKETYLPIEKEYCFKKNNVHNAYTYDNYQTDLMGVIEDILPEIIFCVDFDSHRDHRCLSLTFERVIGKLLRSNLSYNPFILKKFAYENVLMGEYDYFDRCPTINLNGNETGNPFLKWEKRICYDIPENCRTLLIENNFLYKVSKIYKSQRIFISAPKYINDDIVYWNRNSNNLLRNAKIISSSGDIHFLNDFMLFDVSDVEKSESYDFKKCWIPSVEDLHKEIFITFPTEKSISLINFFVMIEGGFGELEIKIFGKNSFFTEGRYKCDKFTVVSIPIQGITVDQLRIQFECNVKFGISEIEVLEEERVFTEFSYHSHNYKKNLISIFDKYLFKVKRKIYSYLPSKYGENGDN